MKESKVQVKKKLIAVVKKIVDDNTVKVVVEKKAQHPIYKKIVKSHKGYLVGKNGLDVKIGDKVMIEECRPLSKNKFFILVK